jgi:23S rRNA pseudouridine1911/1915/1917 synthase
MNPMPRLSHILRELGLSSGQTRQALKNGKVSYQGVPTSDGGREVEAEHVLYRPDAPRITPGRDLAIIYRDPDMVVIWKPAGLLSVPAGKEGGHLNVIGGVRRLLGSAHVVHRIDEQTSGLMMVALNEKAQLSLKEQLFEHSIQRRYLAIVQGRVGQDNWNRQSVLIRNRGDGLRGSRPEDSEEVGKEAITHFFLREQLGRKASLIEARLETGRTHQVRIHLAEGHHPVLGDPLYAPTRTLRAAPRLCLHAALLSFQQPSPGERIRVEAPLADDMELLRRSLIMEAQDSVGSGERGPRPKKPKKPKMNQKAKKALKIKRDKKAKQAKKAKKAKKR